MGGFEGGDESGYWEEGNDTLWKDFAPQRLTQEQSTITKDNDTYTLNAHAKVNIFLKITGHQKGYHTLLSRFSYVKNLYDTICFVPCECERFTIEGCEDIALESNTIYKAYKALNEATGDLDILEFFYTHKVVVTKRIPSQAGLGGGSSDAAAFMRLTKEVCNLMLSTQELAKIGATIGADIPFFIYNYTSANVSGFGEIVEPFDEEPLEIEVMIPNIMCDTTKVYATFKEYLLLDIEPNSFVGWERMDSKSILKEGKMPQACNDLYQASLIAYPKLKEVAKEGWFFSGSGSSFFRLRP